MLGGVTFIYASFGLIGSGVAPLITPIRADLGLSQSAMGFILGAWLLVYIGMAVPAGVVVDRYGLRRALAAGAALVALSGFLRAVAPNGVTLFLAIAVFGIGGPLISVGAPKLVSTWFGGKERGKALGIYISGLSAGGVVALFTANSVLMPLFDDSWRLTLTVYAAVAAVACLVWLFVSRDVAPGRGGGAPSSWRDFPALLRIPVVRLMLVMTVGSFLLLHAYSNWLPEMLRATGMSATEAGAWAAGAMALGVPGALVIPRLATPRWRIPILFACFAATGVCSLLIGSGALVLLALGLVVLGAVRSSITPVSLLTLMEAPRVGARNMGAAGGLYFTTGEIGGVMGPLLMGVLADATGGFGSGQLLLTGVSVVLCCLTVVLGALLRRDSVPAAPAVAGVVALDRPPASVE